MKRLTLFTLLLALAVGAGAQDNNKASKEREALRRSQAALRAAQEQLAALQADKAKTDAELQSARKEAQGAKAQIAGSTARVKTRDEELVALRQQLEAAKKSQQDGQVAAADREAELQKLLQASRQESAARLQANQTLAQLLERSTKALADAEAKNRQLYELGQQLVARWRGRSTLDKTLLEDPVLGLTAVRFEDEAEKLRAELEAARLVR
ncbi:MAG: hypothetical protein EKK53_28110 [Burkholderiales bacterium]|nr:MAG: hypothetical protein EKK53_28110 [Burkholderiales bacterium]